MCCSGLGSTAHSSRQNLLIFRVIYQIVRCFCITQKQMGVADAMIEASFSYNGAMRRNGTRFALISVGERGHQTLLLRLSAVLRNALVMCGKLISHCNFFHKTTCPEFRPSLPPGLLAVSSATTTSTLVWRGHSCIGAGGSPSAGAGGVIKAVSIDFGHTQIIPRKFSHSIAFSGNVLSPSRWSCDFNVLPPSSLIR